MVVARKVIKHQFKGYDVEINLKDVTVKLTRTTTITVPFSLLTSLSNKLAHNAEFKENFMSKAKVCYDYSAESVSKISPEVLALIDNYVVTKSNKKGELMLAPIPRQGFSVDLDLIRWVSSQYSDLVSKGLLKVTAGETTKQDSEIPFRELAIRKSRQYAVTNSERFQTQRVHSLIIARELMELIPGGGVYRLKLIESRSTFKVNMGYGNKEFLEYYVYVTEGLIHLPKAFSRPMPYYDGLNKVLDSTTVESISLDLVAGNDSLKSSTY